VLNIHVTLSVVHAITNGQNLDTSVFGVVLQLDLKFNLNNIHNKSLH